MPSTNHACEYPTTGKSFFQWQKPFFFHQEAPRLPCLLTKLPFSSRTLLPVPIGEGDQAVYFIEIAVFTPPFHKRDFRDPTCSIAIVVSVSYPSANKGGDVWRGKFGLQKLNLAILGWTYFDSLSPLAPLLSPLLLFWDLTKPKSLNPKLRLQLPFLFISEE